MEWLPTESELVVKVAVPDERAEEPRLWPPSLKVTEPVGVPLPEPLALTWAVRVTVWPKTDEAGEGVSATALEALPTVVTMAVEVLVTKEVEPP